MTSEEISSFFHFPAYSKDETSLLKVTAKKLALPIWIPVIWNSQDKINKTLNIIWKSDYRSTQVPVWIFDEDRLRHLYVVGKTGTWKSKFLTSLIIDDLKKGKWVGLIDPHGDLIEDIIGNVEENGMDTSVVEALLKYNVMMMY